jgi:hypothetical protein
VALEQIAGLRLAEPWRACEIFVATSWKTGISLYDPTQSLRSSPLMHKLQIQKTAATRTRQFLRTRLVVQP